MTTKHVTLNAVKGLANRNGISAPILQNTGYQTPVGRDSSLRSE